jgi:histidine triad (HIT) family protein
MRNEERMTTVFGRIIQGELPCKKLFENEWVLAIEDIAPVAPVHILIIPKKPIRNLQALAEEDLSLLGEVVKAAQWLAIKYNIAEGYRLLTNNGEEAGQSVFHLHFHLIGGRKLSFLG